MWVLRQRGLRGGAFEEVGDGVCGDGGNLEAGFGYDLFRYDGF